MDYARNPSPIPGRIRCPSQPLKPYNRSHMQPAPSTRIPDGFLAAMRLEGEKPHQGLPSSNPAPNPVREVCKFTVLLGMRGQAELNRAGSCCTGKERDTESGLDYFGARYYGSSMGRFMSPDPSNWGVDFYNPQTWNHYSYVGNNPLSNTDPNGLWLTPTHHSIIDRGLPGLSKEQRQILKNQSDRVDDDQSQEGSFKHGLESEDNDPMSATGAYNPTYQTNDWIEQNEHDAKEIQADWIASGHTGIAPAALAAFGNAAHTITDEYSPAHTGFQKVNGWTLPWHILRETTILGSWMHKQQQQQAIGALQTAFCATFPDACGQATHEKVTVTIVPVSIQPVDPNQQQQPQDQQQ